MPFVPALNKNITVRQLQDMPTLNQGHFANCKIQTILADGSRFNVLLDRSPKADYDGTPTPPDWPILYEQEINGCVKACDRNGKEL